MQIDKKQNAFSNDLFDLSKSISNASTTGNLYGKLFMLKDMQIFLAEQEKEINEQIKKTEDDRNI
tara:strand:- start:316 stop:510 length:195 start_codon:yes stop_codon:yes gene_type:complete